ncbi:SMC-Scp complex subunit ScpB [Amycolatopsis sp. FBCC-B4732]|uniref:SMC-Scp complex subunit ScpB n=1 Tax=Amycolatopsis sp. FBCC-B4732 TaxID=3079339 RepID=UPI001FF4F597|nr:SMC-Scp complex subunit ScpB [Amycolatopsis sp. FBCC-B4732]UOX90152.1 SMC-Scp complex subunit ScpB [Amycolatopsis sp. FBCC-B4732]
MNPENDEVAEAPAPPVPDEAAAELALDEALSGEPVDEDGSPLEPVAEVTTPEPALSRESADPERALSRESADSEAELSPESDAAEGEPGPDDPESDLVASGDISLLPDVDSDEALEAALESLLLVVDSPASEELLAETLEQPKARIVVALRTMAQKFTDRTSGIDLRRVGEGWRFYTRDVYAPFVEKLLLDGQRSKLTRAALESLAVIAYRQPVTRARVAAVRGVNVDGVIRTLLARGLIEEMGTDPDTTGTLYVTTELFLERLGLSSLNDLPAIAPLLPEVDTIDDIQ